MKPSSLDPERAAGTPPPLSRRGFLQTGAGLALGAMAVPELAAALPPPHASDSPPGSDFALELDAGAIVGLKHAGGETNTQYIQPGGRLGEVIVRWRTNAGAWATARTAELAAGQRPSASADGRTHQATYLLPDPDAPALELSSSFTVEDAAVRWRVTLHNCSGRPIEIGDLALPLPMNSNFRKEPKTAVLKHSLISGDGSFLFWMRRDSAGPYLVATPDASTHLEYWEPQDGYRVFIHSAVAGAEARERGTRWRQPHTALTLASGERRTYGFTLRWAQDYDGVRAILVDEGLIDVQVVPGMTVPSDLSARFALRTRARIHGVDAEFPTSTRIRRLGVKGDIHLYEVTFSRLGENRLTVRFGQDRRMYLEFFATEPVETMIAKRAAFIAAHQHRDPAKWYDGLLAEWASDRKVMLGPDNYDRIRGWRIYAVTCDDPGLSKPAFLASKNALHPEQAEVSALDYYIERFVWGGLQRTTDETFEYGIYGIPDWKQNRGSADPGRNGRKHIWRIYDYPHIVLMYFSMYQVARDYPKVRTMLSAREYLRRAYGTAVAMFTVPWEIERWSAYQTGLYNELVIPDVIDALEANGMSEHAERLRMHWERKVRAFVTERPDLFRSEYAFDSTGFETTHAIAKYALKHAERLARPRPANERFAPIPPEDTQRFLELQMAANLFCRGWLETAYYYLGSDYRGAAGNAYTLSYMSQMGGWAVLDYALHHAADPAPYLRLGYASALSSWALLNSGTPESDYGYWYPGPDNDGAAGGGFEPAPFGTTWLEQPHTRGSWYYSCEIDLGYCGALRAAATVLTDDPIFGRFCFGGDWRQSGGRIEVAMKDGVRRRFHARIEGRRLDLIAVNARFASGPSIVLDGRLTEVRFALESRGLAAHTAAVRLGGFAPGGYVVAAEGRTVAQLTIEDGREAVLELPIEAATRTRTFVIARQERA